MLINCKIVHLNQAYIFQAHQCSVCTFSTAVLCHGAALQSSVHSLVGNSQDTNSVPDRRMALGHTKSSPSQKWLSVLEFCTALSYHKVQFPVFCIKRGNAFLLVQGEWLTPILYQQFATEAEVVKRKSREVKRKLIISQSCVQGL